MPTSFTDRIRRQGRLFIRNQYFWGGLAALLVLALLGYWLFNGVIMPSYTRYEVTVSVPDVTEEPFEEARSILQESNLEIERLVQQYNPNLPRDVVVEQEPLAGEKVKPGRRVYVTVNSGEIPNVAVPSVKALSVREARNRMIAVGLEVADVLPDPIPAPYPNTVTRQEPAAGTQVKQGSEVTLWFSTGLSEEYVTLPDVTGRTVAEAKALLLEHELRAEVVGAGNVPPDEVEEQQVLRQSQEPGAQLPAGSVIRLYLDGPARDGG